MMRSLLFIVLIAGTAHADEAATSRAARSVHLAYKGDAGIAFYNELTVEESVNGSYFMACGFNRGYFGIQQLRDENTKVVIFSIWDPTKGDDPKAVGKDQQVEVLGSGEDVNVSRFGGEGTGAKSMWTYRWKIGVTYRFAVRASILENRTTYSAYFYHPEAAEWKHMATFRTQTEGKLLGGYYSFVEDFRRDGKSPNERRRARFGNGWMRLPDGKWTELTRATFTADATKLDNIDAGVVGKEFHLATGGDTTTTNKLRTLIERPPSGGEPIDFLREIDKPR